MEPSPADVFKSCKLALALENLLDQENATAMTIDCYGTMWDKTIKLPAYPCLGFTRLNNIGLGGICESDLQCAMTHVLFQGLSGKPGFISDPTVDESRNSIILAHCLGTTKMDGPSGPAAPYKLRTVMERTEGVVPQVFMRTGQKVTQAILVGSDRLLYFTGEILDAPDIDRGCRTKIDSQSGWRRSNTVEELVERLAPADVLWGHQRRNEVFLQIQRSSNGQRGSIGMRSASQSRIELRTRRGALFYGRTTL